MSHWHLTSPGAPRPWSGTWRARRWWESPQSLSQSRPSQSEEAPHGLWWSESSWPSADLRENVDCQGVQSFLPFIHSGAVRAFPPSGVWSIHDIRVTLVHSGLEGVTEGETWKYQLHFDQSITKFLLLHVHKFQRGTDFLKKMCCDSCNCRFPSIPQPPKLLVVGPKTEDGWSEEKGSRVDIYQQQLSPVTRFRTESRHRDMDSLDPENGADPRTLCV